MMSEILLKVVLNTIVVIGIDCTGSWKANYHTITTAPRLKGLFTNVYTYNENLEDHLTKKCLMLYSSIKLVLNYLNIYPPVSSPNKTDRHDV
jgi:hypothetical protein